MTRKSPKAASAQSRATRALGLFAVVSYLLAVVILGCKTPEQKYKVLSFFFDGVPDPNAPAILDDEEGAGTAQLAKGVFVHQPYREGKCNSCHAGSAQQYQDFEKVGPDVCMKCHQKELNRYPIMHGPVATGECNICHTPHESSISALLKEPAPPICVQCHVPELLSPEPPEHLDAQKNCLDCHVAHGSDRHGLLRSGFALAPASQPATRSTTRGAP